VPVPLPYILYSALMRRIRPNDGAFTMSTRPLIIPSTVRRAFSGRSASQEMRRAKNRRIYPRRWDGNGAAAAAPTEQTRDRDECRSNEQYSNDVIIDKELTKEPKQ